MAPTPGTSHRLSEGFFIGRYRVVRPLRCDELGETYLAKSSSEHRLVVLRLLPGQAKDGSALPERAADILNAAGELEHSAVARTTPVQRDGGYAFVASECPGGAGGEVLFLSDVLARQEKGLPEERVRSLALQLAKGLEAAHRFRGMGLPYGMLAPESVVLTAQQHPRLLELGVAAALRPDLTCEDDIRSFGELVYRLLTGLSAVDRERGPSTSGVSRFWDRLVGRCFKAGEEGGYAGMGEVISDLESGDVLSGGGGRRGLLVGAGVLVVLVGLAVALVVLHRRGGAASRGAGTSASAVSSRVDRSAQTLAQKVSSQQALAELDPVKTAALASLAQAVELPPGQGFAARIGKLRSEARTAQGLLSSMEFTEARKAYAGLGADARALIADDKVRREALNLRDTFRGILEDVDSDPATTLPAADAQKADALRQAAETALTQGQTQKAEHTFEVAVQTLKQMASAAKAHAKARTASAAFKEEKRRADPALLQRLDPAITSQVNALVAGAEQAAKKGDWAGAEVAWTEARTRLSHALDAATGTAAATPGAHAAPAKVDFQRPASGNLVLNGDFEQGEGTHARYWDPFDNLTTFWDPDGHPGRCVRFDTSVQQKDKRALAANPGRPVKRTTGNQYATVGANEGVWCFSPPIPMKKDDKYFVLSADVWGTKRSSALFYPQVLLRGYQAFDPKTEAGTDSWFQTPHPGGPAFSEQFGPKQRRAREGDYLMVWRHALVCRIAETRKWHRYRLAFELPDNPAFRPQVLLLKCYACWPLGEYRFDNIDLRVVTKAEYEKVKKVGHSIEGFMPVK